MTEVMNKAVIDFFSNSEILDYIVLRPLSHINLSWELIWDFEKDEYLEEEETFAKYLNTLIKEIANTSPPKKYHDNEDALVEYVIKHLGWNITKINGRWIGSDYESILTQGGFHDIDENNLLKASAGRVNSAIKFNQTHFDEMEEGHKKILGPVLTVIIYHRVHK